MKRDLVYYYLLLLEVLTHSSNQRDLNCALHFIKVNPFGTFIILRSPCCLLCFLSIRCNRFILQLLVFSLEHLIEICISEGISDTLSLLKVRKEEENCAFFINLAMKHIFYASRLCTLRFLSWLFCIIYAKGELGKKLSAASCKCSCNRQKLFSRSEKCISDTFHPRRTFRHAVAIPRHSQNSW